MPTHQTKVADGDRVITLTLADSEVTAIGEQLLSLLSSASESLGGGLPINWCEWEGPAGFDEVEMLMRLLGDLHDAAHERKPIDVTRPAWWFRKLARSGVGDAREEMAAALKGDYLPHVDSVARFEEARRHFCGHLAILDRIGWGDDEPDDLEQLHRFAEALA